VDTRDDRITIIEGPPPVFEPANEEWVAGIGEGATFHDAVLTRLRTFNGPALVERCHRAWSKSDAIFLHYRNRLGLEQKVPILAARSDETEGGQVLFLWTVKPENDEEEEEFDSSDDDWMN
jgi:hypothetical protein